MKIINIKKDKQKAINQAVKVLKNGGIIVYPTETCYGIGVDAQNVKAVAKLFQYKGKRWNKPVSIAVSDQKMAQKYVKINKAAKNLYKKFLPGPMTVVSISKNKASTQLQAGGNTLGIRIPNYSFILQLIKLFGKAITSTSANTSGKKQPYSLKDLEKYTSQKKLQMIDLFLDAGKLQNRPSSTVVDTTFNQTSILRQGQIKLPDIKKNTFVTNSENETKKTAQIIFKKFGKELKNHCLIFALQGKLGAGKTVFAKGIGKALNIKQNIVSPTYILMREYPYNNGMFYHIDTWRMEKEKDLKDLKINKMQKPNNIIIIEWLEKIKNYLKKLEKKKNIKVIWVTIEYIGKNRRKINYKS